MDLEKDGKIRCFGGKPGQELYAKYHDEEWAVPCYDDQKLFEMLILEGAQAGLSWETILKKREGYRKAFHHFYVEKVAQMKDEELNLLCSNSSIVRNRLKIYSARDNARIFLKIQKEYALFPSIYGFCTGESLGKRPVNFADLPTKSKKAKSFLKI